jgi:hypothetical protein
MKELHLGKVTYRELSTWFGLKPDSMTKNSKTKERRLKTLSKYADFHMEGNNVYIDKITIPVYSKAYEIIEREFDKEWNQETRIDTCSRVGEAIYRKNKQLQVQVGENTTKSYTNKVKVERYGRNHIRGDRGTRGTSTYIWMDRDGESPLNEEDLKKLRECAMEAYKTPSELIAAIDDDFRRGRLSKEERDIAVGEINTYDAYDRFIDLLLDNVGFVPTKKTLLEEEN